MASRCLFIWVLRIGFVVIGDFGLRELFSSGAASLCEARDRFSQLPGGFSRRARSSSLSSCHVELSETLLTISARWQTRNVQRSFAALRMTISSRRPPGATAPVELRTEN